MGSVVMKRPFYEAIIPHNSKAMFIILSTDEDISVSDGAPGNDPPQRTPTRDPNGFINHYEQADSKIERMWRQKLGRFLFEHVVQRDMAKEGVHLDQHPDRVYLASFPSHYTLWVHKKGSPYDPRTDHYLYGSRYVTLFRSPSEFCLHLKWLLDGQPMKTSGRPGCQCCYCDASLTQGEISQALGTYHPSRRDRDGGRDGKGRGTGGGRKPFASTSTTIPFKDYTKLNSASTS